MAVAVNHHLLASPPSSTPSLLPSPQTHTSLQRGLFKTRVSLTGVSEASWTEENDKALDKFIADSSIRIMVVYSDPFSGLRVEYAIPSQVF